MSDLQDQIAKLERRLQDGFAKIGAAMEHGIEVEKWERAFEGLVREYERLSDELAAAKPTQTAMSGLPRQEAA